MIQFLSIIFYTDKFRLPFENPIWVKTEREVRAKEIVKLGAICINIVMESPLMIIIKRYYRSIVSILFTPCTC